MLSYEYAKNLKPTKEPETIKLSIDTAKEIIEELKIADTGFQNSLKRLLEEKIENHQKEIRRVRSKQYCEHKWHQFTKNEVHLFGSPKYYGIESWDDEWIEKFYLNQFCYCDKCRMPYKYITFKDEDFERIIKEYETEDTITLKEYETEDTITLTAHNESSEFLFERISEEQHAALKEKIKVMEEKVKELRETLGEIIYYTFPDNTPEEVLLENGCRILLKDGSEIHSDSIPEDKRDSVLEIDRTINCSVSAAMQLTERYGGSWITEHIVSD